MGSLAFVIPSHISPERRECLNSAALAGGYDMAPVPTRIEFDAGKLTLTKEANESGYIIVPWPGAGGRQICISTTLRERPEPYHLLIELARGRINQLRCQTVEWEAIGLSLEPAEQEEIRALARVFGRAVRDPDEPGADALAEEALERSAMASIRLSAAFAEQLLHTRVGDEGPLETRVGICLTTIPPTESQTMFRAQFNAVKLVPQWHRIEVDEGSYDWSDFDALVDWSLNTGIQTTIGPMIDLTETELPQWAARLVRDKVALSAAMCDFVQVGVRRYQERVRSWQVCAGFNYVDRYGWDEDERISLAARLLEAARTVDSDLSHVLGISQPWGDYLISEEHTYSPLVFADTLIRSGFTFTSVELEVFVGNGARAGHERDAIILYRLVELFGLLSIPLEISFGERGRDPAAAAPDWTIPSALAMSLPQVAGVHWDLPDAFNQRDGRLSSELLGRFLREFQARYLT